MHRFLLASAACIAACLASLLSGFAAQHLLQAPLLIPGTTLGLLLTYNSGIAFGVALPRLLQAPLIALALGAVLYGALHARSVLEHIGFGLIVGGGLANVIDRLGDNRVTDFIAVGSFPVFNVADSCITVGAGLLLLSAIRARWQSIGRPRLTRSSS